MNVMSGLRPEERFSNLEQIGRGSFGAVYRCTDVVSRDTVAVKIIDLEQAEDEIQDERINPETEIDGEDGKIDNIETMANSSSVTAEELPGRSTNAMLDIADIDLESLDCNSPLERTPEHDSMVSDLVKVWEKWSLSEANENVIPKDLGIELDDVTMSDE